MGWLIRSDGSREPTRWKFYCNLVGRRLGMSDCVPYPYIHQWNFLFLSSLSLSVTVSSWQKWWLSPACEGARARESEHTRCITGRPQRRGDESNFLTSVSVLFRNRLRSYERLMTATIQHFDPVPICLFDFLDAEFSIFVWQMHQIINFIVVRIKRKQRVISYKENVKTINTKNMYCRARMLCRKMSAMKT